MYAPVVDRVEFLTPNFVRVFLQGPDLDGYEMIDQTDAYVNLAFAPAGAPYGGAFDPSEVGDGLPKEMQPVRRRYTVRWWDQQRQELAIDFVVHGDSGVAGRWAANAKPGDVLVFEGTWGGYRPNSDADWYLMVGDESALPAIAASAAVVPAGKKLLMLLLCYGPDYEIPVESPADLELRWLHRDGSSTELVRELQTVDFPSTDVDVFVHGEADEIRALRKHLLVDRGLERSQMSCTPYWRRTMTDEAWREVKRDYLDAMNKDIDAAVADATASN